MNSSRSFNSDRMFGVAAFLISMGTFFIYIYEARLLKKQQYASALPYLEMWNSGPSPGVYKLQLTNNGVGPAFIQDIKVHYKGKTYKGDHVNFYNKVVPRGERIRYISTNVRKGIVIPAGRTLDLVSVESSEADADRMRNLFGNDLVRIEITYSSVYEETWRVIGMNDPPIRLDD